MSFRERVRHVARQAFGQWSWTPPSWAVAAVRGVHRQAPRVIAGVRARPVRSALTALLVVGAVIGIAFGLSWYRALPEPARVGVTWSGAEPIAPGASAPDPLRLRFDAVAAPLESLGKPVAKHVHLEPEWPGVWEWGDDRHLLFRPEREWPVDTAFRVRLEPRLVRSEVRLATREVAFATRPFAASVERLAAFQVPEAPASWRIEAHVAFTHPVDPASFEHATALHLAFPGEPAPAPVSLPVHATYDEARRTVHLVSDPFALPDDDAVVRLSIQPSAASREGRRPMARPVERATALPGVRSVFRVEDVGLNFVENEREELDRVLVIRTSLPIDATALAASVKVWMLASPASPDDADGADDADDADDAATNPRVPSDASEVGPADLARATPLALSPVPASPDGQGVQGFHLDVPAGARLFVRIDKGMAAAGGYRLSRTREALLEAPAVPRQIRIQQQGAMLSLAGERTVSLVTRGVRKLRFSVGRVLPGRVQQLVTQTDVLFGPLEFRGAFDADDLVERFEEDRLVPGGDDGKPRFLSFDFTPYLARLGAANRQGVFVLRVEDVGYELDATSYDGEDGEDASSWWDSDRANPLDRLILVTDLGLLVKTNADGSQDVFVQSIDRGGPVAGATIQVLGRNGLPVARAVTGATGHARFDDLSTFAMERTPTVWWVTRGADQAFLQFSGDRGRGIDLGDADVHGVAAPSPDDLAAHLFTDRGLYRPGEEVHVAYVVKAASWVRLAGVPIEVVVEDVRGVELLRQRVALPKGGFGDVTFPLDPQAPTGGYQATVHLVRAQGHREAEVLDPLGSVGFAVEEFVPDRLRARAEFPAPARAGWAHPDSLSARVSLHNLHGTAAAGHRVAASMVLRAVTPRFPEHPGFVFGVPTERAAEREVDLGEQVTDPEGRASFSLPTDGIGDGVYDLAFSARGFEASGGRGVPAAARVRVSARPFLVGARAPGGLDFLARNARTAVDLIAVDPGLARVEASGLSVSWIARRRVSVLASTYGGDYRYETTVREVALGTDRLDIGARGASLPLRTRESGDFLAVVRDATGVEVARIAYAVRGGAGFQDEDDDGGGNVLLQARLDRSVVAPGDTIEVRLETPFAGAGLATIERERVHAWTWFRAEKGTSVQRIQVPRDFEGNGYVVVTYLRAPESVDVFVNPLGAVALPFTVSRDRRTVRVDLDVPAQARPGTSLRVVHRTDRPSRVVVYAVDEGILQVARYRLPDLLATFLPRQELGVSTRQNLDLVMPEHSRLKAALRVGGDEDGLGTDRHLNPFRRKGYRPMAFWSGIVESGPVGRVIDIPLPVTFNGTVRVMAVAVADDAVGVTASPCVVRSPVVVLPDAPLFVAPGDRFQAAVTVEYLPEPLAGEAEVEVRLQGDAFVDAGAKRPATTRLAAGRWAHFPFEVQAGPEPGLARLEFTVQAGDVTAVHPVEISVRPVMPHRVTSTGGRARGEVAGVPVSRRLAAFARSQSVSASVLPLSMARGLATYLDEYPYLCTEQLVSRALAVLALREHPELGPGAARTREATERAIRALRERQNDEGAFGVWAANATVSYFQNVYALQFLTEAKTQGLDVGSMLDTGLAWLRTAEPDDDAGLSGLRSQANAAYVLARNGEVPSDLLGDLREALATRAPDDWERDVAAAYLAATYRLLEMRDEANRLIGRVAFDAVGKDASAYEDEAVQAARLLYLLARHFPERLAGRNAPPVEMLVDRVIAGPVTTLSAGVGVQALAAYARVASPDAVAPVRVEEIGPQGAASDLALPAGLFPRAPLSPDTEAIRVHAGKTPVYFQVVQAGYDVNPPAEPVRNGLEVTADLVGLDGKPVASVRLGDTVEMRVRVRAAGAEPVHDAVLVVPLPGGFEMVREPGPGDVAVTGPAWSPDHVELREDRLLAFGTVGPTAGTFAWRMTAIGVGAFAVPPPFVEAMYRPAIHGAGVPGRVVVTGRE